MEKTEGSESSNFVMNIKIHEHATENCHHYRWK